MATGGTDDGVGGSGARGCMNLPLVGMFRRAKIALRRVVLRDIRNEGLLPTGPSWTGKQTNPRPAQTKPKSFGAKSRAAVIFIADVL